MADLECLRQLRRVVEAAPEGRFDMSIFSEEDRCGAVYCAAGWAAVDPWFRANTRLGSTFHRERNGHLIWEATPLPVLMEVFDLDRISARNLFGLDLHAGDVVTKRAVLRNIDRAIAGNPAQPYRITITAESRRPRPPQYDSHSAPIASFGGGSPAS
jgi:hypothetical protein